MNFGCQSMVDPLKRVIVKRPQEAFVSVERIESQWKELNYTGCPDLKQAIAEHEAFVSLLQKGGAEVLFLPEDPATGMDSIYPHDPAIVTDAGAVVFQTGKPARRGEGPAMANAMESWGVPVFGLKSKDAVAEGGDMVWLDRRTLLVGRGFRTNEAAVKELRSWLATYNIHTIEFHLPYFKGPSEVLHLMSFLSLLDKDLAAVYLRLMPAPLFQLLQEKNIRMVEVEENEYNTLGCNVLAMSPRQVLMVEGNPVTKRRLQNAGCQVTEFQGLEIAVKGTGGPTCLTRPLLREYL